jgi:hypothetical protein
LKSQVKTEVLRGEDTIVTMNADIMSIEIMKEEEEEEEEEEDDMGRNNMKE